MEKPFTIKVNDLHENLIKILNEAKMPFYVLKTILLDIIKEIDNSDNLEINKYLQELNSNKGDDKNGK